MKLAGTSTVVHDQINERASGMQILNELMKIKNAPGKGVRLISKTSLPPDPQLPPLSLCSGDLTSAVRGLRCGFPRNGHCLVSF